MKYQQDMQTKSGNNSSFEGMSNLRGNSNGSRASHNMSQLSTGSMNLSHQGYASDQNKQLASKEYPDQIMVNNDPPGRISNSSGGIEDLQSWLKSESVKQYELSLKKLGLDNSKIQGKHLVSYTLDEL